MPTLLIVLALVMGIASAVQGASNGALSGRIGLSSAVLLNALVVFGVALAAWLATPRGEGSLAGHPWYLYLGGLYGLTIIAGAAYAFPRLGPGPTTALMVSAQLATALTLDHLGLPKEKLAVTPLRLVGVAFLIVGALLVLWPKLSSRS